MLLREGAVVPHIRFGRYEIGGGFFQDWQRRFKYSLKSTKLIIKHYIQGSDGWLETESFRSVGFKCFLFAVYILRYDNKICDCTCTDKLCLNCFKDLQEAR